MNHLYERKKKIIIIKRSHLGLIHAAHDCCFWKLKEMVRREGGGGGGGGGC